MPGRLIDVDAGRAYNDRTIRCLAATSLPASRTASRTGRAGDDTVVDLRERHVMPGLMDTHVHLTGQYSARSNLNRFI